LSTILIISPEPWEGHFVSKHHYAIELALRGHDVLFFGPPEASSTIRLERVVRENAVLRVVRAGRVAPALRFLPGWVRRGLEAAWLRRLEAVAGTHIDVVWLFENSRFFDMRFAGDRLKIYHQVDLNQDLHPDRAAATADIAIAISGPIAERLKGAASLPLRITHGCQWRPAGALPAQGEERFAGCQVHAMLTGNLDTVYMDTQLVSDLVADHPEVRFHFVGRYTIDSGLHQALQSAPNAVFWGPLPAMDLPALLARADILLVTYLADTYLQQLANPHKIMEYLASGRAVLATRTLEYEERPGLIEIAPDREAYRAMFKAMAADPQHWNSEANVARRRAFAGDHTYGRQIDRIAAALGDRGGLVS